MRLDRHLSLPPWLRTVTLYFYSFAEIRRLLSPWSLTVIAPVQPYFFSKIHILKNVNNEKDTFFVSHVKQQRWWMLKIQRKKDTTNSFDHPLVEKRSRIKRIDRRSRTITIIYTPISLPLILPSPRTIPQEQRGDFCWRSVVSRIRSPYL